MKNKFEQSDDKAAIRSKILSQFIQYIYNNNNLNTPNKTCLKDIYISTLPGEHFSFESHLIGIKSILPHLNFNISSFEYNKEIYDDDIIKPFKFSDEHILNDIAKYDFPYKIHAQDRFFIHYFNDWFRPRLTDHIIWADICGVPSEKFIDALLSVLNNSECRENKLVYITHTLRWRSGVSPELKKLKKKYPSLSNEDILIKFYTDKLGLNNTLVFKYTYKSAHCPMITLGWHTQKQSEIVPFIHNNENKPKADKLSNTVSKVNPERDRILDLLSQGISSDEIVVQLKVTKMKIAGIKAGLKRKQNLANKGVLV